jgi:hypothetical protein
VADATFPNPNGYNDRKAILIVRQNLDDDSKEAMIAEHGTGMIHVAQRPVEFERSQEPPIIDDACAVTNGSSSAPSGVQSIAGIAA